MPSFSTGNVKYKIIILFFKCNTRIRFNSFRGSGVLVCSIDNMPTQLPMESTDLFGNLVLPYAMDILQSDAAVPLEEHTFSPTVLGVTV